MLAAALRPGDVRSLALIEPAAHRAAIAEAPAMTPQEWLRAATEAVGLPPLEPTPARLRAAATAMRERPCWEADVPLDALAAGPYPKLVIRGTWETAPAAYREAAGEALMACAEVVARAIGVDVLRVGGASHWPHAERPDVVNAALRRLWRRAAGRRRYDGRQWPRSRPKPSSGRCTRRRRSARCASSSTGSIATAAASSSSLRSS